MTIGEKIRDIRIKRGMTQGELGGDMVTPSMISQIEADRAKPSYTLLTELANRLGMPVEYFMNEMDDQFSFTAQLSIAAYHTATQNPEAALRYLEAIQDVPERGLNHQEYTFAIAQVYRKLKRYAECTSHLEHLREAAFRTQDHRLLFFVCRESGYVEAELENMDGAIHEWKRAVETGYLIRKADSMNTMEITVYLSEVLLALDKVTEGQLSDSDRPYLRQAHELTSSMPDLRAVSDRFVEDAAACVHTDAAKARTLAEKANTLLSFARLVEQVTVVGSRLSQVENSIPADPWQYPAVSMTSIYPDLFLNTECDQIERMLQTGDAQAAAERLHKLASFVKLLSQHQPHRDFQPTRLRLRLLEGQLLALEGEQEKAMRHLESFVHDYPADANAEPLAKAYALLVLWNGEQKATDKVVEYCRKMEQLLVTHEKVGTPLLV